MASIVYANRIADKFHIDSGTCTMICDNKGVLASSFGHKQINPRWKSYDLLCMIRFRLANSPIKWKNKHIKGHQDNNTPYADLDIISQANVNVDTLAKIELQRNREVDDHQVLPGQCWKLLNSTDGERIQGNIESSLWQVIYEDEMKNFWKTKFGLVRDISQAEWKLMKKVNIAHQEWEHLF